MFNSIKIEDIKLLIAQLSKELRKNQGLSQSELADALSLSRITIQNLESASNVTIDTWLKVMQYFNLLDKIHLLINDELSNTDIKSLY